MKDELRALHEYNCTQRYADRVVELENEGLTTSDAQGVADVEFLTAYRATRKSA